MKTKLVLILSLILSVGLLASCQNTGNQDEQLEKTKKKTNPSVNPSENQQTNKSQNKKQASQNNENIKVTFIELGSKNCIPCKKMEPIMEAIEKKYPDQVEVKFYDVRTREGRPYAKKYGIRVIPTQVFLNAEGNEFFRHQGFFPQKELEKVLKQEGVK
jgi:thioredoxin 1